MKSRISILPVLCIAAAVLVGSIYSASVLPSAAGIGSSLKIEFSGYEVRESEATVVIAVLRNGASDLPATVDYTTASLTALAGKDYTQAAGQLTFAPGETLNLVSVPILNDALREPNETFRFTLTNAIGASLNAQKSATVTIKDSDPGVGFGTGRFYVHEDEHALRVTVRRGSNVASMPVTVDFATVDGTARAGEDYFATNGTLAFAAGQLSQSFEVGLVDDGVLELDENLRLVLSDPTGGAILSAFTNLIVTLCDSSGSAPHGFAGIHADADGIVKLTFAGGVSKRYQPFFDLYPVEVSTNLVDWQMLALLQRTNSATNEFTFLDSGAKETTARFHRVLTNHFTAAWPKPTGPYPVGKIVRMMHDTTRRNRYNISTNGSFAINIFYPAAPTAGQHPAPWFEESFARDTAPEGGTLWYDRVPHLSTYSFPDAPLTDAPGPLPVILFSPGANVDRTQDTEKLEELASHGYLVVAIEHFDAYNVAWPDGFYYSRTDDKTFVSPEGLKDRVRDLSLVLDEMITWNRTDARFSGRIDLDRIGAMGMSWGGATVADFAQRDSRCRAVVLLDPGSFTESLLNFSPGFPKPSLTMHRPDNSDQFVFAASKTNAIWFQISKTDHGSFVNEIIFSSAPLALNREAVRTIQAYTLSFFNKWLKGQDDHLYESSSASFPRVINYRKK